MTHSKTTQSAYGQAILNRGEFPSEIIDCHAHMGRMGLQHIPREGSAEAIVEMMDSIGVSSVCFSHHLSLSGDIETGNRLAIEAAEAFPDRFFVYLTLNPNYPESFLVDMLDRYVDHPSVIGLKFHTTLHNAEPGDDRYRVGYEYAKTHGLAILSHIWGVSQVTEFAERAREFSTVPFIFGHSGGYELAANVKAAEVGREVPNAYLDLCLSGMYEGVVEYFVNEAGEEKVLFGSDMPFMSPCANLGRVAFADISDSAKERVLGGTMQSILAQCRRASG